MPTSLPNSAGELHYWFTLFNRAHAGIAAQLKSAQGRAPQCKEVWAVVAAWMIDSSAPFDIGLVRKGNPRSAQTLALKTLEALPADATGIEAEGEQAEAVEALLKQVVRPSRELILPANMAAAAEVVNGGIMSALLGLRALLDRSRAVADAESLRGVAEVLVELRELLISDVSLEDDVRRLLLARVAQAEEAVTAARSGVDIEAALERLAGSLLIYSDEIPGNIAQRAWAAISGALRTRKLELANAGLQAGAVILQVTAGG